MKEMLTEATEALHVARSMKRFGGGFVKALGDALSRADSDNRRRIREAFPEYWARYLELYDRMDGEEED